MKQYSNDSIFIIITKKIVSFCCSFLSMTRHHLLFAVQNFHYYSSHCDAIPVTTHVGGMVYFYEYLAVIVARKYLLKKRRGDSQERGIIFYTPSRRHNNISWCWLSPPYISIAAYMTPPHHIYAFITISWTEISRRSRSTTTTATTTSSTATNTSFALQCFSTSIYYIINRIYYYIINRIPHHLQPHPTMTTD